MNGMRESMCSGEAMMDALQAGCVRDARDLSRALINLNEVLQWSKNLGSQAKESMKKSVFRFYKHFRLSCSTLLHVFEELFSVMAWLYQENGQNVSDFRLIVQQTLPTSRKQRAHMTAEDIAVNTSVRIICLNAGFIFDPIKEDCSSIILASGND